VGLAAGHPSCSGEASKPVSSERDHTQEKASNFNGNISVGEINLKWSDKNLQKEEDTNAEAEAE
jgi:hypothetical protein